MSAIAQTTSNSERLRYKLAVALPELVAAGQALRSHPRLAALYPEYLFTTHCMVRATVPLMEAALERCHALAATDPVAAALAPYLAKHIPEERHAHWVLEDLEVLGFERSSVLQRQPPPTVAAMVGAQYYWIFHFHPVALLGYMEIMEGYPPTAEQVDALVAATGHPRTAFRTLERHVRLDIPHRAELHAVIDALPLTPQQSGLIGVSALQSLHVGSQAIRETIEQFDRRT